jgi:hypothetical protein
MRFRVVFSMVFLFFLFISCKDNSSPTNAGDNPYQGTWAVTLSGDLTGGGDMIINGNGSFSDNWTMGLGSSTYNTLIQGSVSNAGIVSGTISSSGRQIGSLSGAVSLQSDSGAAVGTGTGVYSINYPSSENGTWRARKK